jgi:hypothetical protein
MVYASIGQPTVDWQINLGGTSNDAARTICQTFDGGYITAGTTYSNNGDVTGFRGNRDYWVVKLNSSGGVEWQKCFGGSGVDEAYSIEQTSDSGYILAGYSSSQDGDVTGNHGVADYWILKLNNTGDIVWERSYGGSGSDWAYDIQQTFDGGFIIAGMTTTNNDGDVTGYHFSTTGGDFWILKIDSAANIQWQYCFGGTGVDMASSVEQTIDSGFVLVGYTTSNDGDVVGNHGGGDQWVVKLTSLGVLQWQNCSGGSERDEAWSIDQTIDGGYVIAGSTNSIDGDVTGSYGAGDYNSWIVKLDSSGQLQWQRCYGGTDRDGTYSIQQTSDGGFITSGLSESNDGNVSGNHGGQDYWILKLDIAGLIQWQKCLGGSLNDVSTTVRQTSDGGYIFSGVSYSSNGNVINNRGGSDYWIVKLSGSLVQTIEYDKLSVNIYPNPTSGHFILEVPNVLIGSHLVIYDSNGIAIMSKNIQAEKSIIELIDFKSGAYFISVAEIFTTQIILIE